LAIKFSIVCSESRTALTKTIEKSIHTVDLYSHH
jgi:hypothetical protein